MPKKQDWTPRRGAIAAALAPELTASLRRGIASQRTLFEYDGPPEVFWETVTQDQWDHEVFLIVGTTSGMMKHALEMAKEFGVILPDGLIEEANFFIYEG